MSDKSNVPSSLLRPFFKILGMTKSDHQKKSRSGHKRETLAEKHARRLAEIQAAKDAIKNEPHEDQLPDIKEETPSIMSMSTRRSSLSSISLESVVIADQSDKKPTFKSYLNDPPGDGVKGKAMAMVAPQVPEKIRRPSNLDHMVEQLKRRKSRLMIDVKDKRRSLSPDQNDMIRKKSLKLKIFGDGNNDRRFSEDLFPTISELMISRSSLGDKNFNDNDNDQHDNDQDKDLKDVLNYVDEKPETTKVIFYQVFVPFLIAGFDNVGAGIILDIVQHWSVFKHAPELFILVASFLGLKGNLEMTLAARLATMSNLGQLDNKENRFKIARGNVALVQGQAIIVAFLASLVAIIVNFFKDPDFNLPDCLLITATGLTTASITGLAMANLMVTATILARKFGVNPDNVSALIASIMGDISAITLLAFSARFFYHMLKGHLWLLIVIIIAYLILLPFMIMIAARNEFTRDVVGTGWIPIIAAMFISSCAGFIFDLAISSFETIAVVQPIINGVGGNLVAVQASRISTYYHLRVPMGTGLDHDQDKTSSCPSPKSAFFGKNPNVKTARLLLLMSIPIHIVYFSTIYFFKSGEIVISASYLIFYLLVVLIQISILLFMAHILVPILWMRSINPDNAAVPILMAIADVLGASLLTTAYFILSLLNDPYVSLHTDVDFMTPSSNVSLHNF